MLYLHKKDNTSQNMSLMNKMRLINSNKTKKYTKKWPITKYVMNHRIAWVKDDWHHVQRDNGKIEALSLGSSRLRNELKHKSWNSWYSTPLKAKQKKTTFDTADSMFETGLLFPIHPRKESLVINVQGMSSSRPTMLNYVVWPPIFSLHYWIYMTVLVIKHKRGPTGKFGGKNGSRIEWCTISSWIITTADIPNSQDSETVNYHIFLGILEYHEEIPSLGVLLAAPLKLVENHARIPCKCYPYEETRKIFLCRTWKMH